MLTWFKDWFNPAKPDPIQSNPIAAYATGSDADRTTSRLMRRQLILDHHLRAHAYALSLRHLPQAIHADAHCPKRLLWLELEWANLASSPLPKFIRNIN